MYFVTSVLDDITCITSNTDTPCTSDTNRFVDRCLYSVTIVSLVLKDALTGTQAGAGFVSTRK